MLSKLTINDYLIRMIRRGISKYGIRRIPLTDPVLLELPLTSSKANVNVHVYQAPENISPKFHNPCGYSALLWNECCLVKRLSAIGLRMPFRLRERSYSSDMQG